MSCTVAVILLLGFITTRASEHGSDRLGVLYIYIYIYMCVQKKNLVNYGSNLPQVVATDFFLKINRPSAAEHLVTQRRPWYSAVSASDESFTRLF